MHFNKLRTVILSLPVILFLILSAYILNKEDVLHKNIAESYVFNDTFGKYLFVEYEITSLLSEPGRVDEYYYQLVQISNQDSPFIIIKYRQDEAEEIGKKLNDLPRVFQGRTDSDAGEAHEFIKKYLIKPALDKGYPSTIKDNMYLSFNISNFKHAHTYRAVVLALIAGILLLLPVIDFIVNQRRKASATLK